jgi:hypothetical protein
MGEKNLDEQPLPATTTFYRIVCVPFLVAVRCFADMMLMINCRHIVESCSVEVLVSSCAQCRCISELDKGSIYDVFVFCFA